MNPLPSLPRRACSAALTALLLASVLFAALTTGTAAAAPGTGEVTLTLKSDAKGSLSKQGVAATYSAKAGKTGSAKKRKQASANGRAQILALPVADLALGKMPTVRTKGSIGLTLKGRSASLGDVIVQLGQKSTAISAKLDGSRIVFFRAKGTPQVDGSSVKLDNAKLSLTNAGAKALRAALGASGITGGPAGSATVSAKLAAAKPVVPAPAPVPAPIKIDDGGLKPDPSAPYPYETQCPVGNVAGGPGFGHPPGTIAGIAPAPTFNPGTAQEVSGDSLEWGFKDSFRSYVGNVPPSGSMLGLAGAGTSPAGPSMATPGSYFDFPVAQGTYEPGTEPDHSDDTLVAKGSGAALFCKAGHGFSVAIRNPIVVIDGENSRISAEVGANQNGTWYRYQRADIAELDLSAVAPQLADGGNTLVWEDIPATLTADGALALGLYDADEPLDSITVKTAVQRPLLAECTIDSGTVPPTTAVDFTQAALPTLSNPVTGSGGTINWGFRRATRNTVAMAGSGGSFQLLGGATEGYPGNMGGGNSAAPTGGLGKFFRFPIAQYSYEEGAPGDPGDDRLIATSNATVGFCNPSVGNFALVISKPTLVIDGGNSRLIANAYSYSGGFPTPSPKGWIGGRVELVNLNTSAVGAVSAPSTVSWGEVPADNTPLTSGIPVSGGLKTEALSLASLTILSTAAGGFDPVSAQIALPTP